MQDRLDTDVEIGQDARDLGQHAGFVERMQTQVIRGLDILDREDRQIHERIRLKRQMRHAVVRIHRQRTHNVHEIGDHGRGRRFGSGTGSVKHCRAHGVALDQHRIHGPIHVGYEPTFGNQRRVHAQLHAAVRASRNAEQLEAVAEIFGVLHVHAGNPGDALGVGLLEFERNAEGDGRQNRELVCGIDAFHVKRRIGLGITQSLRFLQRVGEVRALVAHLRENEIARAVDDAGQPFDAIAREPFAHRLDDGNTAGHRGFERHHHAFFLRLGENFVAMHGDQSLVRGNHMFAVGDGLEHQGTRRFVTADQFDHHLDLGIAHHRMRVLYQLDAVGRTWPLFLQVARRGLDDVDFAPGAACDFLPVACQHADRAAAYGAEAENADFDRFHVCFMNYGNHG